MIQPLVASMVLVCASATLVYAQRLDASAFDPFAIRFEANAGQAPADARFVARGAGYSLLMTDCGAVVRSGGHRDVRVEFIGGTLTSSPQGEALTGGVVNYLLGKDPSQWHRNVATFERVRYVDVYPGIDVVYHTSQGQMEYDVVVAPGADPRRVRMRFAGADSVSLEPAGDLTVKVGDSHLTIRKPVLYQDDGDGRRPVDGAFAVRADGDIGFEVGHYDTSASLIIDPVLVYSSYLPQRSGGLLVAAQTAGHSPRGIAVSSTGAMYLVGNVYNTFGSADHQDVFIARIAPSGSSLTFITYLGGLSVDGAAAMTLGPSGAIFVAGATWSYDFPVVSGSPTLAGGGGDAFFAKLAPTGDVLELSTIVGGSSIDSASAIAVDAGDNVYLAGLTESDDFPLLFGPAPSVGINDVFVRKYDAGGQSLYSVLLGGGGTERINAARVAPDGTLLVAGQTSSETFPVTPGAFDTTYAGGEAFVARLAPDDGRVLQGTFLGGTTHDEVRGIDVDASNMVYVTGETRSSGFPTTPGVVQPTSPGNGTNAFVAKLNPALSALVYSTFLGGTGDDAGLSLSVDALGQAVVVGSVRSNNFPQSQALHPFSEGSVPPSFITKLSASGAQFVHSTYWPAYLSAVTVGVNGDAYVTGSAWQPNTGSTVYPVTPDALLVPTALQFASPGVISRISDTSPDCTYQLRPSLFVASGSATGFTLRALSLVAPSGCAWTAASDDPSWLNPSVTAGSGSGYIPLSLTQLASGSRTGTITVGNGSEMHTVTVVQRTCTPSAVAPTLQPAAGGPLIVSLFGAQHCAWVAVPDSPWVTASPDVGSLDGAGQGQLTLLLAPNPSIAARNSSVLLTDSSRGGGISFPVPQAGRCTAAVSGPTSAHRTGSISLFTVTVTPPDCQWTAKSDAPWLVPSVSTGVGSQTLEVVAAAHTFGNRSAKLVIADQERSFSQSGASFSQTPGVNPPMPAFGSGHSETFTFTFFNANGGVAGTVRLLADPIEVLIRPDEQRAL